MSLIQKEMNILQEIIDLEGKCLDSIRCSKCPFRATCLPTFLDDSPISHQKRLRMALDVLSYDAILDDDAMEEVKSSNGRESKK